MNLESVKKVKHDMTFVCAGLFIIGIVIFLIGALGPVMGSGALTFFAIKSGGILAIGVGLSATVILAGCTGISRFAKEKIEVSTIFFEFLQFLLSCFVYCGGSLLVLVCVLSFDLKSITVFTGGIFASAGIVSIIFMVRFRKYRKAHPKKMEHISSFLIMIFFLAIGMFFLLGGLQEGTKVAKDMIEPLPIERNILENVRITAHYRPRAITDYYIKGTDRNGEEISFRIDFSTYKEWRERCESNESLTAYVSYYKNSKVIYEISRL